jgi:HPt (histidine-containing phosphotransfer) domain-containing protein
MRKRFPAASRFTGNLPVRVQILHMNTGRTETQGRLDVAHLRMMTGEDAALAGELLGIFRQQADIWSRLLDSSAPQAQWSDACHTIKGAASSIGAFSLAEACAAAEQLGRGAETTPLRASVLLGVVRDRLGETLEAAAVIEHAITLRREFPAD